MLYRRLAVGLENGHVLIYSCGVNNAKEWQLDLTIDST